MNSNSDTQKCKQQSKEEWKSVQNCHYRKVGFYWLLLFGGIFVSWLFIQNLETYCQHTFLNSPESVFSIISLIAIIVLLFIWGYFIRDLIRYEYNNYHKEKKKEDNSTYRMQFESLEKTIKELSSEMETIKKELESVKGDVSKPKNNS